MSDKELKVLREIKDLCMDISFAESNPEFSNFCDQSPENLKVELQKILIRQMIFLGNPYKYIEYIV